MRVRDVIIERSAMRGPLSEALDGYEDRPGQLAMAEAVEHALSHEMPLFVEAGTGTGKTLAYLIPAILSGKKVVISTATRALEEQIFTKDLPLVATVLRAFGIEFRAAMMKGLANYLCKRRFHELRGSAEGVRFGSDRELVKIERWAKDTEIGDRAELVDLPEDAEGWRDVQSSTETRIGAECKYFDECFVTQMKRDAEEAQIVVVNHHLFCADLALRSGKRGDFGGVLPPYDAVIFDEAHQLEDVATHFFGVRASTARIEGLTRDARRSIVASGGKGHGRLLEQIEESARAFFAALAQRGSSRPGESRRVLTDDDLHGATFALYGKLGAALEALENYAELDRREEAMALVARRARDLRSDLDTIVRGSKKSGPSPYSQLDESEERRSSDVVWLDVRDRSVSIGASPIDLGPTLRENLFDRVKTVICTSATLATGNSFHFAKARLGAPPETVELVVASPFDFAANSALYLPRDLPEPADPAFEPIAVERIIELVEITRGGAFILSTSTRAMRSLHAALKKRIAHPVLVQGEAPKHLLLSRFRAAGDAVLVATMSFWEGVDVPGHALRLVILDKIPFAVPSDPLVAARCAEVEREGGNAFSQYSVPAAAITLKQGFGRLIRTQKDVGIVTILDRRITTKGYGKALLASLPPARRFGDIDELRAFWAELSTRATESS